ncbi:hypothetical protein NEPTK9_000998 [Candidatus Neptunochlamydia vexilliferae]|uniref:Uncharacterized protein n=1 Tax=Candidatus Neptunichlamydia vexilliferae TaxID=1651774 RepID=A0ABS0AZV1_9BACT|nr:hypothetical protein [Candidatus Neptunochlamydia vexilliferae]
MPKKIPKQELDQILDILSQFPSGASLQDIIGSLKIAIKMFRSKKKASASPISN